MFFIRFETHEVQKTRLRGILVQVWKKRDKNSSEKPKTFHKITI